MGDVFLTVHYLFIHWFQFCFWPETYFLLPQCPPGLGLQAWTTTLSSFFFLKRWGSHFLVQVGPNSFLSLPSGWNSTGTHYCHHVQLFQKYLLIYLAAVGLELRASHLLGKCFTTPPAFFELGIFQNRFLWTIYSGWLFLIFASLSI
jgi:hypothetical protein